jgi:hypothetical protein
VGLTRKLHVRSARPHPLPLLYGPSLTSKHPGEAGDLQCGPLKAAAAVRVADASPRVTIPASEPHRGLDTFRQEDPGFSSVAARQTIRKVEPVHWYGKSASTRS